VDRAATHGGVGVFAVVITGMGFYGASVEETWRSRLDVPGSESALAAEEAGRRFGIGAADLLILYRNPEGDVRDAEFGSRIIDGLEPVLADAGVVARRPSTTPISGRRLARRTRDARGRVARRRQRQKLETFRRIEPLLAPSSRPSKRRSAASSASRCWSSRPPARMPPPPRRSRCRSRRC